MKKISGTTFFIKKVGPFLWFGFITCVLFFSLLPDVKIQSPISFYIFIFGMLTAGYFIFSKYAWQLVDEVYDLGDSLLFRKGKKEQTVNLKDILNINFAQTPAKVTFYLRNQGEIGKELSFTLPIRLKFYAEDPSINELIKRVDEARNA